MLGDEPGTLAPVLDPAALRPAPAEVSVPDPDVLDNARQRLASHYATSGGRYSRQLLTVPADDIRAVGAVTSAVRSGAERPADALDVGAGLAVLSHLRHCLDELETDLLDGAQQVGLSWDVIAAILGIPVLQAQSRHRSLRARLDAQ